MGRGYDDLDWPEYLMSKAQAEQIKHEFRENKSDWVNKMRPGRELDEKVAAKIFGLVQHDSYRHLWRSPTHLYNPFVELPKYSTDIIEARTIIDQKGLLQGFTMGLKGEKWVLYDTDLKPYVEGDSPPHVICLGALKLV